MRAERIMRDALVTAHGRGESGWDISADTEDLVRRIVRAACPLMVRAARAADAGKPYTYWRDGKRLLWWVVVIRYGGIWLPIAPGRYMRREEAKLVVAKMRRMAHRGRQPRQR